MADRKVLNKYYPPDFDPTKLPRGQRPKNDQECVRLMMPMSVRCNTCGEYIYRGKKFNSKKETVAGEDYLGIRIFRFYMRCPVCSAEFTIKTDPKNSHYLSEINCSMNHEPWQFKDQELLAKKNQRKEEDEADPMKALENRTRDSKIEMDIIEALDSIRSLNARNNKIKPDDVLQTLKEQQELKEKELQEDEERELENARKIFSQKMQEKPSIAPKAVDLKVESKVELKPKVGQSGIILNKKKAEPAKPVLKKKVIPTPIAKKKELSSDTSAVKKAKLVDYDSD